MVIAMTRWRLATDEEAAFACDDRFYVDIHISEIISLREPET
jgi:hypothetical protein